MPITLDQLRRYALARSLFKPTTLRRAIERLGFVQADPIRAPARAQDLTLRHRVIGYRVGDLERRYPRLALEEDFFVNYGYLPRTHQQLMHPRLPAAALRGRRALRAAAILEFIRERGTVHPREVDRHFAHGRVRNWFGGSSSASTQLLDLMQYGGLIRVARREAGTRLYAALEPSAEAASIDAKERLDRLIDIIVEKYAPLPASSLTELVRRLRGGTPQWSAQCGAALRRAQARLGHVRLEGADWYFPARERPQSRSWTLAEAVRFLAPFDPVVWDRRRFELFWRWRYRFEAYTPAPKRQLGYYALPLLWHEQVIGWANLTARAGRLSCEFGYVGGAAPASLAFRRELESEIERLRSFLALEHQT